MSRKEESLFEFDSSLAQVVIGVRRSGKSTICHKVLNTVLSCIYQLYGTDVPCLFLDEIQNVDGWHYY